MIFIGYSLPDADYHFRGLLLRAIRPTTRIRVFLGPRSDPTSYSSAAERENLPYNRYRRLFGDVVEFNYGGFEALVDELSRADLSMYHRWIAAHLPNAA